MLNFGKFVLVLHDEVAQPKNYNAEWHAQSEADNRHENLAVNYKLGDLEEGESKKKLVLIEE